MLVRAAGSRSTTPGGSSISSTPVSAPNGTCHGRPSLGDDRDVRVVDLDLDPAGVRFVEHRAVEDLRAGQAVREQAGDARAVPRLRASARANVSKRRPSPVSTSRPPGQRSISRR